jgi:SAM-dependent methyltransferase
MSSKIEILSTELLEVHRPLVQDLRRLANSLGLEFGWHYLLDLTWIISQIDLTQSKMVLDAGAGTGILQWYLAEQGVNVTSVDRSSRQALPLRFRSRYRVDGLRHDDLAPATTLIRHQLAENQFRPLFSSLIYGVSGALKAKAPGEVVIYNQDLRELIDLADNSFDVVVAVSALEHNPPENLGVVVRELMRVLKPGGVLLATLCAAENRDWYHEPSQGWCYTADSLRKAFDLPSTVPDNYAHYAELFSRLKNNAELRDNLASFYSRSGKNGMPWGKWDPQYQPVGVRKEKEKMDE